MKNGEITQLKLPNGEILTARITEPKALIFTDPDAVTIAEKKDIFRYIKGLLPPEPVPKPEEDRKAPSNLGPKIGTLHAVPIMQNIVKEMKSLPFKKQKELINEVFPNTSKSTKRKYLYTYRQWLKIKDPKYMGRPSKTKKTTNVGYENRTPIKADILSEIRGKSRQKQKEILTKHYPDHKSTTLRKYLNSYRSWIKKHPTTNEIATKLANGRPETGETIIKVGAVYIKDKVFSEYKENPTKETLKKYFPHLSPASLDTYVGCYNKYLHRQKQAEEIHVKPGDLRRVKAKMVTLWREGLPINKKNLQSMLNDLSNKKLSSILNALIKNREVKYDSKNDCFEVLL